MHPEARVPRPQFSHYAATQRSAGRSDTPVCASEVEVMVSGVRRKDEMSEGRWQLPPGAARVYYRLGHETRRVDLIVYACDDI